MSYSAGLLFFWTMNYSCISILVWAWDKSLHTVFIIALLQKSWESFYMSIFFYEASRLYLKKKKKSYLCCCFHLLNALHFHACCSVASNSCKNSQLCKKFYCFHCLFLMRWCYSCHSVADKIFKMAWDVIKYTEHKQFCINCCNSVQASMLRAFLMLIGSNVILC